MKTFARIILVLGVGLGALQTPAQVVEPYTFASLNQGIPDGNWSGLSDVQPITSAIARLDHVRVRLQIAGEFNGDLYGYLRHTTPTVTNFCVLLNRPGRSTFLPYGYADAGLDIEFDDLAPNGNIHVYQNVTHPPRAIPLNGQWQPDGRRADADVVVDESPVETTLADFNGVEASGTWTLYLADVDMGAANMLLGWGLELTGATEPVITWGTPANIVYGTPLGPSQLNAAAGTVAGTFAYDPPAGTILNAGTHALQAVFTPADSATYLSTTTSVSITVAPKDLVVTANNASKAYDGAPFSGGNGVTCVGFVNGETIAVLGGILTYTGPCQGAVDAGSYNILPGGLASDNYAITYNSGTLAIARAPLSITANNAAKVYDGLAFSGGNGVTYTGFVNGETAAALGGVLAYIGAAQGAVNAGAYVIAPTGLTSSNYEITFNPGTLTIGKALLTITANSAVKIYDGLVFSGGNGVTYAGFVNGETAAALGGNLAYTGTSQGAVNAGVYAITPGGLTSDNYAITFTSGNLTINQTALSITANDATKVYDGLAFSGGTGVTYAGFVNGETAAALGGVLAYSGTSQGAVNAGSYSIIPSGLTSANYSITFNNGTLAIARAVISITANDAAKVYDGLVFSGGNGVTYAGLANGETAAVLGGALTYTGNSQGAVNAGSYSIIPGGLTSANYEITFNSGTLAINRASLSITANNAAKVYDGLPFSGGNGVTYTGFVNGETTSALSGALTYSGTSQGAVNAGAYVIAPTGPTSSNYEITFNPGTLTIGKALLTVTANSAAKTYDGLTFSGGNGVSYAGFVNGETAAALGGTLAYSGTSQGAVNAGVYAITPGGLTSDNYAITCISGTLTINRTALSITANDATKIYDGLAFSGGNGVTYAGFVNGETAAALGGVLAYSGTSQGAVNAGSYSITPGGLTSANYNITFNNGTLAITRAGLSITANDAAKVYDGLTFSGGNGVIYAGLVNGETAAALSGTLTYSGTSQGAVNAGSYSITPGGLTSDNYALTFVNGTLAIAKAITAGTVTASGNPVRPDNPVTFTVTLHTVAPGGGTPTGSVRFVLGAAQPGFPAALSAGIGTYTASSLAAGTYVVSAEYPGDENFMGTTNNLAAGLVVNAAPVAAPDLIARYGTNGVKVAITTLLTNDSDPEGDPVSFVAVSATSTNGGTLTLDGDWVHYSPPPGSTNADAFNYTISDGYGTPVSGLVMVQVVTDQLPSPNLSLFHLGNGSFLLQFNGIPRLRYQVEYCDSLNAPNWTALGGATADSVGLFHFLDTPPAGTTQRYYRSVFPGSY